MGALVGGLLAGCVRSERIRRSLIVLMAAFVGVLGWSSCAHAQFGIGAVVTAVPASATPDGTVTISATRLSGLHTFSARLVPVGGGTATTLFSQLTSADSLQRDVVIPALVPGKYTLELRSDSTTIDTTAFAVVAPLMLSFNPAGATPGSTVKFSVSGLSSGSLVLEYAGAAAFGPVSVTTSSYSGKFRVPDDRPAKLPATVAVQARNTVGKLTASRVGSADFAVGAINTSPFAKLISATPSTTTPPRNAAFNISGKLALNEASGGDVAVSQYWKSGDGRVAPLGASSYTVDSAGNFTTSQRTPQFGTMSAYQASGSAQVMTVASARDANGALQFTSKNAASITSEFDTDNTVDITLLLRGSNSQPLVGARVDLSTTDANALFGDPNAAAFNIDGTQHAAATQYNANPTMAGGSCPAGLQRQYSDDEGRAEFEFTVDPPQGGYYLDGSTPHQATIAPSTNCIPVFGGGGRKIGEQCTAVDPAGLFFTLTIRTAHLGFGYRDSQGAELPVTVTARVDKYTAQIHTTTCRPGQACVDQGFTGSANLVISEPQLADAGLDVGDPYFKQDVNDPGIPARAGQAAGADPYRFADIANLTPFKNSGAAFSTLVQRSLRFAYYPGGGKALREAHLLLEKPNKSGYELVGDFVREGGPVPCDVADGAETWKYTFSGGFANLFRFPTERWPAATGNFQACGYIYGQNLDGKGFARKFCLNWAKTPASLVALDNVSINDFAPSAVKIEGTQLFAGGDTSSPAPPSEYNVGKKDNAVDSGATIGACVPNPQYPFCSAYTLFAQNHEQFSRHPSSQPSQSNYGDGVTQQSHDWEELFDITIPLFRWYWGVPELLSAEVFADLGIKAQALFDLYFDPAHPDTFHQDLGGAMSVAIFIGVDIDVLFGILIDAGAMISGAAISSIVTHNDAQGANVDACFAFQMDFSGWLEIGCPIPNPFDPTCYIPDIEETFNILDARDPSGCSLPDDKMAQALKAATTQSPAGTPPPPVNPLTPEQRRALYRHPAIAFASDGSGIALWLDDHGQLVSGPVLGRAVADARSIVSTGWGIRDVAVEFLGTNRAVAVWAENSLSDDPFRKATLTSKAQKQHLRYAQWDGKTWSAPADLTAPGFGEGQVRLRRCTGSALNCPRNGLVTAVWQRNTAGDMYHASMHVFSADFNGSSWTTPVQVDQSGALNITPTLTYQNGVPVIGWVRHDPGAALKNTDLRHFAYRKLDGKSLEHVDATLPAGIAAPSLATVDATTLALSFTLVDAGFGFIGTRQALYLGSATCSGGSCAFTSWKAQDASGRAIYGERPQTLIDDAGMAVVTLRGLGFGPDAGGDTIYPDDPPGMRTNSGDLIQLRSPLAAGPAPVLALSQDAATHFQPAAAVNPQTGDVVALSVNLATPATRALQLQPTMLQARAPQAASLSAVDDGIELAATALAPDLAVAAIVASSKPLVAGGNLAVKVTVQNIGSDFTPDADRYASLKVWWDNPQTRSTSVGAIIPALPPGGRQTFQLSLPVPSAFADDERQTIRAAIVASDAVAELDGTNNEAARSVGGMPLPLNPRVVLAPATRMTHLAWDALADARVAGFRIYVEDEPGEIRPLGSSFNNGFVDLTAQYGVPRRYYVSTYSNRGVESEMAGPLIAAPIEGDDDSLFANGFE